MQALNGRQPEEIKKYNQNCTFKKIKDLFLFVHATEQIKFVSLV